jgi:hypothetical protein
MDNLNEFLNAKDCLNTRPDSQNSFQFDVQTDRNAVGAVNIRNLTADKILAGTISVAIGLGTEGTGYIKLDGGNNNIVVNDGSNDRVLIGYQLNGF